MKVIIEEAKSYVKGDERAVEGTIDLDGNNILEFQLSTSPEEYGMTTVYIRQTNDYWRDVETELDVCGFDNYEVYETILAHVNEKYSAPVIPDKQIKQKSRT